MDWDAEDYFGDSDQWGTPQKRLRLSRSLSPRPIQTTPPAAASPTPAEKPLISNDMPVDYRLLLLSLAEQYIGEAQRQAVLIAHRQPEANVEAYSRLLATGLGYYAAVLQKHRLDLSPRQEAAIQLRYATIMFETTENTEDVETILSRAIPACERNRLADLKYSMQHLMARVMLKSKPKASLKYLDGLANDVAVSNHVPWIYAFRFLGVSLSFQTGGPHDMHPSLQHLRVITDVSRRNGDWAVLATGAIMEATIHLRSRGAEFLREAQTAIANARAALMSDTENKLEWLHFLVEYLDLACSLDPLELATAKDKVDRVIRLRSQLQESLNVTDGRDIPVVVSTPIHSGGSISLTGNTGGIFSKDSSGVDCLNFSWLSRRERLTLYFSLVPLYVHSHRTQGLQHLEDALQWCQRPPRTIQTGVATDLLTECKHAQWNASIRCYVLILLTVLRCEDSQLEKAKLSLQQLLQSIVDPMLRPSDDLRCLTQYVNAVVLHATGDLDEALKMYKEMTPFDKPLPDPNSPHGNPVFKELAVLARLNALLIIRPSTHPSHHLLTVLLDSLKLYFSGSTATTSVSQNRSLVAAYEFLNTILSPDAIIDTKLHLQRCLKLAKDSANLQLIAMGTSYLYSFMFTGIVGDKALQYAHSSLTTAKSAKSKTLQCVASGLIAGALELEGRTNEADAARQRGVELLPWLAEPLKVTSNE